MKKSDRHPGPRVVANRARRERLGISQARLAELVGLTDTAIALIERGERTPREPTLRAIEAILKRQERQKMRRTMPRRLKPRKGDER